MTYYATKDIKKGYIKSDAVIKKFSDLKDMNDWLGGRSSQGKFYDHWKILDDDEVDGGMYTPSKSNYKPFDRSEVLIEWGHYDDVTDVPQMPEYTKHKEWIKDGSGTWRKGNVMTNPCGSDVRSPSGNEQCSIHPAIDVYVNPELLEGEL